MLKLAFAGFRHGHIMSVYRHAQQHPDDWRITGACEEDADTRRHLQEKGAVTVTHHDYAAMLDEVECDAVAVGDYYSKRGRLILTALQRGKHVISDKPICTDLDECRQIAALAGQNDLKLGCQFDLRVSGRFLRLRELVRDGAIGAVQAASISGQHPLNLGTRPAWYFEPGKHGGTINDIGIHVFDLLPWITGLAFAEITAARTWNALVPQYPHFRDGAQFMARLQNDAGVMADVSYFSPSAYRGKVRQYWRLTLFGAGGILETGPLSGGVLLARNGGADEECFPPLEPDAGQSLPHSFAREIAGDSEGLVLSTAEVLRASHAALLAQQAADTGRTGLPL